MVKPHIADTVDSLVDAQNATNGTLDDLIAWGAETTDAVNEHDDLIDDLSECLNEHADGFENHAECLEAIYAELDELTERIEAAAYDKADGLRTREMFDAVGKQIDNLCDLVDLLFQSRTQFYKFRDDSTFLSRLRWLFTGR